MGGHHNHPSNDYNCELRILLYFVPRRKARPYVAISSLISKEKFTSLYIITSRIYLQFFLSLTYLFCCYFFSSGPSFPNTPLSLKTSWKCLLLFVAVHLLPNRPEDALKFHLNVCWWKRNVSFIFPFQKYNSCGFSGDNFSLTKRRWGLWRLVLFAKVYCP